MDEQNNEAQEHGLELLQAWMLATELLFAVGRYTGGDQKQLQAWDRALESFFAQARERADHPARWPESRRLSSLMGAWNGDLLGEIFSPRHVSEVRRQFGG